MNVFLISRYGESTRLAELLQEEGHNVETFIKERPYKKVGSGILTTISDPGVAAIHGDLTIVDDIGSGAFVDKAKKMGKRVIGSGMGMENFLSDLTMQIEVLTSLKMKLATEKTEGKYAVVGAWFDGENFVKPILVGTKYTKAAAGDIGPITKGMGACVKFTMKSKLFHETLLKLASFLRSVNFVGFINCDCLINNDTVHIKSISTSLGFLIGAILPDMFLNPIGEFLKALYEKKCRTVPVKVDRIHLGVSAILLPWGRANERLVVVNTPVFIPIGVSKHKDYILERGDGLIGLVIGHGSSPTEARNIAYREIKKVRNETLLYRNDIENDNQFNILEHLGWWK